MYIYTYKYSYRHFFLIFIRKYQEETITTKHGSTITARIFCAGCHGVDQWVPADMNNMLCICYVVSYQQRVPIYIYISIVSAWLCLGYVLSKWLLAIIPCDQQTRCQKGSFNMRGSGFSIPMLDGNNIDVAMIDVSNIVSG